MQLRITHRYNYPGEVRSKYDSWTDTVGGGGQSRIRRKQLVAISCFALFQGDYCETGEPVNGTDNRVGVIEESKRQVI